MELVKLLVIALSFIKLLEWIATRMCWVKARYLTKPPSLLILLLLFIKLGCWVVPGNWFGAGLIYSLGGDIFLLLHSRLLSRDGSPFWKHTFITSSDRLLATGCFLRPVPYGNFQVMFSYHLRQVGIILRASVMLGKFNF